MSLIVRLAVAGFRCPAWRARRGSTEKKGRWRRVSDPIEAGYSCAYAVGNGCSVGERNGVYLEVFEFDRVSCRILK